MSNANLRKSGLAAFAVLAIGATSLTLSSGTLTQGLLLSDASRLGARTLASLDPYAGYAPVSLGGFFDQSSGLGASGFQAPMATALFTQDHLDQVGEGLPGAYDPNQFRFDFSFPPEVSRVFFGYESVWHKMNQGANYRSAQYWGMPGIETKNANYWSSPFVTDRKMDQTPWVGQGYQAPSPGTAPQRPSLQAI